VSHRIKVKVNYIYGFEFLIHTAIYNSPIRLNAFKKYIVYKHLKVYVQIFCKRNKWFKKLTVNYTFTLGHYVGSK